jgi:CRP/FNR family transcriptional regulator, cyclic AMP receptor protein
MEQRIAEAIARFFNKYPEQVFEAGEMLIKSDEQPTGIFYIVSGQVKQSDINQKGNELVLNVFKQPSFFPVTWALNGSENIYQYQAVTKTVTRRAPANEVMEWLKVQPDVVFDLLLRLQSGIEGLMKRMSFMMAGSAAEKLIIELVIAGQRFGEKTDRGIILKLSVNELSARSGLARETASRELTKLKSAGLIRSVRGGLKIPNLDNLAARLAR